MRYKSGALSQSGFYKTQRNTFTRNQFWPSYSILPDDGKIMGLFAVWPDRTNYFTFLGTGGTSYTIDYGDGSTPQTYSSAVQADYIYDYDDPNLSGTNAPVTIYSGSNFINRSNHGLLDGQEIRLYGSSQVNSLTPYYVKLIDANNFFISLTPGGSTVTFASSETAYLLPYKIAIITITGSITTAGFTQFPTSIGSISRAFSSGWLELIIAMPTLTSFLLGNSTTNRPTFDQIEIVKVLSMASIDTFADKFRNLYNVREVYFSENIAGATNASSMFNGCINLERINTFNTSNVTTFSSIFNSCYKLKEAPRLDYSKATNVSTAFQDCFSLEYVPDLNLTSACSSMGSMFTGCKSLKSAPNLGVTSNVITMTSLFVNCYSLEYIPDIDCTSATSLSSIFQGCTSLKNAPKLLNVNKASTVSSLFSGCHNLKNVPYMDTANVKIFSSMFNECYSLESIPELDLSTANNVNSMFVNCVSLKEYNLANTPNIINVYNNFHTNCWNLKEVPALNMSNTNINLNSVFSNCPNLNRIKAYGISNTVSVATCQLSNTGLEEIFTNLATVTSKTITITDNPGAASCDRTIATAKGWTVSG